MMTIFTLQKDFPYNINIPTLINPTAKTPPSPMPKLLPTAAPFMLNGFDEPLPVPRVEVGRSAVAPPSVVVVGRADVILRLKVTTCETLVAGNVGVGVGVALSLGESCI